MKTNKVIHTQGVKEFCSTAQRLERVEAGVPGMGLVHGQRGLGKTTAAIYYSSQKSNNAVYIRAKADWSYNWMMEETLIELGVTPRRGEKAKYDDLINALVERPRLLILDEGNLISPKLLETLRSVNDMTHNPILFVGHEGVIDKYRRQGPFFDRLLYITEVKPLSLDDLLVFATECLDLPVDKEVLVQIREMADGNFRRAVVKLKRLEDKAKAGQLKAITSALLKAELKEG